MSVVGCSIAGASIVWAFLVESACNVCSAENSSDLVHK